MCLKAILLKSISAEMTPKLKKMLTHGGKVISAKQAENHH